MEKTSATPSWASPARSIYQFFSHKKEQKYSQLESVETDAGVFHDSTASRLEKKLKFYKLCCFLLALISIVQGLFLLARGFRWRHEVEQILRSPVPEIPWELRKFTKDESMMHPHTVEEVERVWSGYETTVFVHVPNPLEYGLRPNRDTIPGSRNIYMPTVYHQLHCLKKLQKAFANMTTATPEDGAVAGMHAEHCFDYLRQGILCAGDSTLEGPDPEGTLLGYGFSHMCRQWDGPGGLEEYRKKYWVDSGAS